MNQIRPAPDSAQQISHKINGLIAGIKLVLQNHDVGALTASDTILEIRPAFDALESTWLEYRAIQKRSAIEGKAP